MKKLLLVAILVACGGKKPEPAKAPDTSTSNPEPGAAGSGAGTPCAQEIALVCPDDQIDGCLKTPQEGTTHACVAK